MIDPLLQLKLRQVARRKQRLRRLGLLSVVWAATGAVALGLTTMSSQFPSLVVYGLPIILLAGLIAGLVLLLKPGRAKTAGEIAGEIEAAHPELDGRLLTAVAQPEFDSHVPPGYLRRRLLKEVLAHDKERKWASLIPNSKLAAARAANLLALALFLFAAAQLRWPAADRPERSRIVYGPGIHVSPGDALLEKGSSLVVLAKFGGPLPASVDLVVESGNKVPLVKSLADPMFGGSVPEVSSNFTYYVEYGGKRTRDYKVTVYEFPRLERADVDLTFPAYTGHEPKRIENTRRLTAVEGSIADLHLTLNKPVVSVALVSREKDKVSVDLAASLDQPMAALVKFPLIASGTYDLRLEDAEGRTNKVAAQFVFNVLTNAIPEMRLAIPRGDLRPSPIEEISFQGTVWDDFGVPAFGVGYMVVGEETTWVELGTNVPAKEKRAFDYVLKLEDLNLSPDQLVSWFVWADDLGADGQVRRNAGDLYFGEIRPFDEIFREGQGMQAGGQQQGGQSGEGQGEGAAGKLAEIQKQIISATWKLQRQQGGSMLPPERKESKVKGDESSSLRPPPYLQSRFFGAMAQSQTPGRGGRTPRNASEQEQRRAGPLESNLDVVRESQAEVLRQAEEILNQQNDPKASTLWRTAIQDMRKAIDRLSSPNLTAAEISEALAAEQSAYQAILKLQEREYQVSRSRQQNSGQAGNSRQNQMQRQLEQMDLAQSENRYETQRQAQSPQAQQRQEDLRVMNRLQELARRQGDVNERLKELQSALQEARTEEDREELRRRLKRLQEEEQRMLADLDELRQQMDRPENQSRNAEQRQQLDEIRDDVQRAADAVAQGSAAQALASGARAQEQLQQMRDEMRRESSGQFAEEMRDMRNQARELARQQEELLNKLQQSGESERRSLSESSKQAELLKELSTQKQRMTNVIAQATQISQEAELPEPLLSKQLYETVRQFSQDTGREVKEMQDKMLDRGVMTRNLMERLRDPEGSEGEKLLDIASEMLRHDFAPPAREAGERARQAFDNLRQGVERAAESIIGDDTEALRLARQQLQDLTDQLGREIAENLSTNEMAAASGQGRAGDEGDRQRQPNQTDDVLQQLAQAGTRQQAETSGNPQAAEAGQPRPTNGEQQQDQQGQQAGSQSASQPGRGQPGQPGERQNSPEERAETALVQGEGAGAQRGDSRRGGQRSSASGGGGRGGELSRSLGETLDRMFDNSTDFESPLTGDGFVPWSDRLRDVEEMIEVPDLRTDVARVRERARQIRQEFREERKKPDWAVVRMQVMSPLVEIRERISDELARRQSREALVPIDRDPVPTRYSELVRRYYEEIGKDK